MPSYGVSADIPVPVSCGAWGRRSRRFGVLFQGLYLPSSACGVWGRRLGRFGSCFWGVYLPSSATFGFVAEDGGFSRLRGLPILRFRRAVRESPMVEVGVSFCAPVSSVFGELCMGSPKSEVWGPFSGVATSVFGEWFRGRRSRMFRRVRCNTHGVAKSLWWCYRTKLFARVAEW